MPLPEPLQRAYANEEFLRWPLDQQQEFTASHIKGFRDLPDAEQAELLDSWIPRRRQRAEVAAEIAALPQTETGRRDMVRDRLEAEAEKIRVGDLVGTRAEPLIPKLWRQTNVQAQAALRGALSPIDLAYAARGAIRSGFGANPDMPAEPAGEALVRAAGDDPALYQPQSAGEKTLTRVSEGAGAALPFAAGLGVAALSRGGAAALEAPAASTAARIGRELIEPQIQHPLAAAGAEVAAGAGAGAGGRIAEDYGVPRPIGELAGGAVGGAPFLARAARPSGAEVAPQNPLRLEPPTRGERPLRELVNAEQVARNEVELAEARIAAVPPPAAAPGGKPPEPTRIGFEEIVNLETHARVVNAMEDLLTSGNVARNPNLLISDQTADLLRSGRIDEATFRDVLARNNLSRDEFADAWRLGGVRTSAQRLQRLSAAEARIKKLMGDELTEQETRTLTSPRDEFIVNYQSVENLRRGMMVTQLGTAMANATVNAGRLGLDVFESALAGDPRTAANQIARVLRPLKTKQQVDELLAAFPTAEDELFLRYATDIERGTTPLQRTVDVLNTFNRIADYAFRYPIFAARLDKRLRAKGSSIEDVVESQRFDLVEEDDLNDAVAHALEMTFAKRYSRHAGGMEGRVGGFLHFWNNTGVGPLRLTLFEPFLRMTANGLEFLYHRSPIPLAKRLMKPSEWDRLSEGDAEMAAKATSGALMFATALQLRNSPYAGDKWNELYTNADREGDPVDMRRYWPLSAYLWMADTVKRGHDGTLDSLKIKDLMQGAVGLNRRGGVGLWAVDEALEAAAGIESPDRFLEIAKRLGGEYAASWLTPLEQIQSVAQHVDPEQRAILDTDQAPFLGPIATRFPTDIPGVETGIPSPAEALGLEPVELATREGPPIRVNPLQRQLFGMTRTQARNAFESELVKHGFDYREINPNTGNKELNAIVRKHMGAFVERNILPVFLTPEYLAADHKLQGVMLSQLLQQARQVGTAAAMLENPELVEKARQEGLPRRSLERYILENPENARAILQGARAGGLR